MFFLLALGNISREASSRQSRAHSWLASGKWCFKTQWIFLGGHLFTSFQGLDKPSSKLRLEENKGVKETPRTLLILCAKLLLSPLCFFSSLLPEWLWSVFLKSGRLWTVSHSSKSVKQNIWPSPQSRKNKETTALTVLKSDEFFLHNIDRGHDNLSYYISERSEITLTLHCSAKRWIIKCCSCPSICFFPHNFQFLHNRIKTRMEVHFYII